MVPRFLFPLLALVLMAALLAGCGERVSREVTPETPATAAATPHPYTTMPETTTAPTAPLPTTPPISFPGALSLGTPYRYGREDISMEVTVYKVKVMDEYDWWSWKWGRYWNTTPKKGHHFLFALVRFIDRGTSRALLPAPHTLVLKSNGNSYVETTDRDNSLWIKGIDVKQYEYYFEATGGWIDPGESNKVEGFMIYEVPLSVTPQNSYLDVIFSGKAASTWKLG
jgi:hypothetical protein